jgi:hypothetical protein
MLLLLLLPDLQPPQTRCMCILYWCIHRWPPTVSTAPQLTTTTTNGPAPPPAYIKGGIPTPRQLDWRKKNNNENASRNKPVHPALAGMTAATSRNNHAPIHPSLQHPALLELSSTTAVPLMDRPASTTTSSSSQKPTSFLKTNSQRNQYMPRICHPSAASTVHPTMMRGLIDLRPSVLLVVTEECTFGFFVG